MSPSITYHTKTCELNLRCRSTDYFLRVDSLLYKTSLKQKLIRETQALIHKKTNNILSNQNQIYL